MPVELLVPISIFVLGVIVCIALGSMGIDRITDTK